MSRSLMVSFAVTCWLISAAHAAPELKTPAQLVARMAAAAASLEDYEVTGVGESDGKKNEFKVYFKKPDLVRIDTERGQVSVQPNGTIRGRLGKGAFGMISRKIERDDAQLKDEEGIAFYDSHYAATVKRIQDQLQAGAKASMKTLPDGYELEVHSGNTTWRYTLDKNSFFFRENSRTVDGKVVETTRYSDFHPNAGLKATFFKF